MVGIVIVSHSYRIAEGVAELAREMGGPDVALETAGGLDLPDHPIGTDAVMVMAAIERAWSPDGVLVLMDLGSAVLSTEMALDLLDDERRDRILLCEAPLVEGAVAAAVTAKLGASLEAVAAEARGGLAGKIAHLGVASPPAPGVAEPSPAAEDGAMVRLLVPNPHGLHARPAARFVQTATPFDAAITVRNLTNGRGPADARSLNAVATLGVAKDHEIEVRAAGPQAQEALAALVALAARRFDEQPESDAPAPAGDAAPHTGDDGVLHGFAASPGIAIGPARHAHVPELAVPPAPDGLLDPAAEAGAFDRALAQTRDDIARQRERVADRAGEAQAEIFDAHLLFLQDDALLAPTRRAIAGDGATAAHAWQAAVDATAAGWDALDDDYLRARADDLRSVGVQVLARILGLPVPRPQMDAPGILVAIDLTPADTSELDPAVTLGIATARGGPTSHAAVLARSLGIPAVVGLGDAVETFAEGGTLALDGSAGTVQADPSPDELRRLRDAIHAQESALRTARVRALEPAVTVDGLAVEVALNIGRPEEVAAGVAAGADGVGLFRTEFLFMGRDTMPDEDEQTAAYAAAADALDGRPLLLRTLDAGADKPIPYLAQASEENPFLGVRGIRLGLVRPDLLATQLRAVVRAAEGRRLRVMFPMVATMDELLRAREALDSARAAVGGDATLEVGVMIEVPAAALTARALAAHVEFFSIGTNDLTQYTLAADRGNENVAAISDALHPAVLSLIRATVEGARAHGRWVGVCGEIAGDAAATALLLGLGVTELSMSAPAIAPVKHAVRATRMDDARALGERALACATAAEVRALLMPD